MSAAMTYASYLRLDDILTAQTPRSAHDGEFEHDEMLFIIIHQVYELWFKEILHEIDHLKELLYANDTSRALHTFRRLLTILKVVVGQIDVLETMTPLEFSSFRGFLATASGFQSIQFRELEFVLGHKRRNVLNHFPEGMFGREKLEVRYEQPTLWDAFLCFLHNNSYAIPQEQLNRDVTQRIEPSEGVQAVLVSVYRENPVIARICERMVDMDEGLQEWRYRHVQMVARTIGSKQGTGGSSGVQYLRSTLSPAFPDLWAIRKDL